MAQHAPQHQDSMAASFLLSVAGWDIGVTFLLMASAGLLTLCRLRLGDGHPWPVDGDDSSRLIWPQCMKDSSETAFSSGLSWLVLVLLEKLVRLLESWAWLT